METTKTTQILDFNQEITGVYATVFDEVITNIAIVGEIFSGSRYEEVIFEDVEFIECSFQATDFINCKFIDCTFRNCTFNFVKLEDCNMVACKIEDCTFCITNSHNSNFLSCTYINNNWEASSHKGSLLNCNIDHTELVSMNITQSFEAPTLSSIMELQVA
jgi:uncharacterized protein YjbI with pentapeptide repeats